MDRTIKQSNSPPSTAVENAIISMATNFFAANAEEPLDCQVREGLQLLAMHYEYETTLTVPNITYCIAKGIRMLIEKAETLPKPQSKKAKVSRGTTGSYIAFGRKIRPFTGPLLNPPHNSRARFAFFRSGVHGEYLRGNRHRLENVIGLCLIKKDRGHSIEPVARVSRVSMADIARQRKKEDDIAEEDISMHEAVRDLARDKEFLITGIELTTLVGIAFLVTGMEPVVGRFDQVMRDWMETGFLHTLAAEFDGELATRQAERRWSSSTTLVEDSPTDYAD